tara:strand:- start:2238 stop:2543 length:306 start_codon:yes stop_codon:yes gene_type:complete
MRIHQLKQVQLLPITLSEAWDYFSTPLNLNEITPDDMHFEVLTKGLENQKMYEGMIINYIVRPVANVPMLENMSILLMSNALVHMHFGITNIFLKIIQREY